jgi:pyruvate ferredoxin oxidoreductase alpha subunit
MATTEVLTASQTAMTGNEAVAEAMRQINPDVVAAYPITPQTDIVQNFAKYVADGKVDTVFVTVESEHSAMSATVGAASSGARSMTATSANGLALMWEVVYIASSSRLPIVMPVVNRALSGPINIHCDHSDSMGARDSSWIQLYSENAQEVYDNMLQAIRIGEDSRIRLPVMVMQDGFITSHAMDNLHLLSDEAVTEWTGEFECEHSLLGDSPITAGPLDLQDYYFEHKRQQSYAMEHVLDVVREVGEEFEKVSGRSYGVLDLYKMEDAELALVVLSSTAGTARITIDQLRAEGIRAGLIKPRVIRPFPHAEFRAALSGLEGVVIMDRSDTFSTAGGPLSIEIRSALYPMDKRPTLLPVIYGLGGRDITPGEIATVFTRLNELLDAGEMNPEPYYLGLRD